MTLIILYILWRAVGTPIVVAILTFLLTAIHIYFENIWNLLIRQNVGYREWNRLRKEWNKTAAIERRRQFIMSLYLDHEVKKNKGYQRSIGSIMLHWYETYMYRNTLKANF